jgi:hypothetical protein
MSFKFVLLKKLHYTLLLNLHDLLSTPKNTDLTVTASLLFFDSFINFEDKEKQLAFI